MTLSQLKYEYGFPNLRCKFNEMYSLCPARDPVKNNPKKRNILKHIQKLRKIIEKLVGKN
jgi:hypothetical protein